MTSVRKIGVEDGPQVDKPASEAEWQAVYERILAKKADGQQLTMREGNLLAIWGTGWEVRDSKA